MGKVKLLKDHVLGSKGDTVEVTPEQENYLQRVGVTAKENGKTDTTTIGTKGNAKGKKG